ncbi:MAG: hypothetical protein EOM54_05610 [Clostridia bacterium]|nr:hypothetical protein [Clostridia bacterium]
MPTIIDTLITDRVAADSARVTALEAKGFAAMTAAEQAEWLGKMKGAYDYIDLNRVGQAISCLAGLLNGYGYSASVSPKTDWTADDFDSFHATEAAKYLSDLGIIKAAFYGTTKLPADMDGLTVTEANAIETLLVEIETYINNMVAAFNYCGEIYCGEAYP